MGDKVDPRQVVHGYVETKTGVCLHFVERGQGPVVFLIHGWPESWFSWRYQIKALSDAGFRVIAPDNRGFGDSDCPPAVTDYTLAQITSDYDAIIEALGIEAAVFIGHDWGGAAVWAMVQHYPHRVTAVGALNTPFFPVNPKVNPIEGLKKDPQRFDYQLYFQEEGRAEAEFERDIEYSLTCILRGSSLQDAKPLLNSGVVLSTSNVRERGGMLVGFPPKEALPRSTMLSEEDMAYYVQQYTKSRFRGGLNWYRNVERNWEWSKRVAGQKIFKPACMITTGKDKVLTPDMTKQMDDWIPKLRRYHIENCSHWTQQECPAQVNAFLIEWLQNDVFPQEGSTAPQHHYENKKAKL